MMRDEKDKYEINLSLSWEDVVEMIDTFTESDVLAIKLDETAKAEIVTDVCAQRGNHIRKRRNLPGSKTSEKEKELEEIRRKIRAEILGEDVETVEKAEKVAEKMNELSERTEQDEKPEGGKPEAGE